MIVVIARGSQKLKSEVTNDWWGAVINKEKLPLETVTGGELCLTRMYDWEFSDELRCQKSPRGHEDGLVSSRSHRVGPVSSKLRDRGLD